LRFIISLLYCRKASKLLKCSSLSQYRSRETLNEMNNDSSLKNQTIAHFNNSISFLG
jgi:hypothetical protein